MPSAVVVVVVNTTPFPVQNRNLKLSLIVLVSCCPSIIIPGEFH